jgi:hypothetical protein
MTDEIYYDAKDYDTYIYPIIELAHNYDVGEEIRWFPDSNTRKIKAWVLCNDLFWWATADGEDITLENLPLLEQTLKEVKEIASQYLAKKDTHTYVDIIMQAISLFCCRSRKMRPQTPCYKEIPEELKPLFDACGPYRTPEECG